MPLFSAGEPLESTRRSAHAFQQLAAQPAASSCECDSLDAPVVWIRVAGDQSPRLEPVDESGDVRVIARQDRREFGHGQRRGELQQSPCLRRMQVQLGGCDEKAPTLLS